MTRTADRLGSGTDPLAVEPAPRRPLLSRLSLGHVIMILAGLLAFLLVLVVLRERGESFQIAVAAQQIDAGTQLQATDVRYASLTDADAPTQKSRQYFEMLTHRALWADGWKAVTLHPSRNAKLRIGDPDEGDVIRVRLECLGDQRGAGPTLGQPSA